MVPSRTESSVIVAESGRMCADRRPLMPETARGPRTDWNALADELSVLTSRELRLDADTVLRAQGADPQAVRARGSAAVGVAERATRVGSRLLRPAVAHELRRVVAFRHGAIQLAGGARLTGALISSQLFACEYVLVAVCTVGAELEDRASAYSRADPSLSYALDAYGSAAVHLLSTAVQDTAARHAAASGLSVTAALSPGLEGWSVAHGQPQVFSIVDAETIGVTLTSSRMMLPHKSASLVIGMGEDLVAGDPCDFCGIADTCRIRTMGGHHAG